MPADPQTTASPVRRGEPAADSNQRDAPGVSRPSGGADERTAQFSPRIVCRRCHGAKQLPIDCAPGAPPEWCHRCEGSGAEPEWASSKKDYLHELIKAFENRAGARLLAALVAAWLTADGSVHYDFGQLPPDAETRVACCANGPASDGSCLRDINDVR